MCEPQKTVGRFDKKKFFWIFMLRRLFSVFRDEKKIFLKFFFRISFSSYSQLFSIPANNFSMNWFHACLYYFIKKIRLWPQTSRRRSFFVVHPSESQCVTFVLAQLKDLFWPHFHRFLPDWKPISKQRFPPTNVFINRLVWEVKEIFKKIKRKFREKNSIKF